MAATAVKNRLFTADVAVMAYGQEDTTIGTFVSRPLVGVFTNAKIEFTNETVMANIPSDLFDANIHGFEYHVFQGYSWSVDVSTVQDDTLSNGQFLVAAFGIIPSAGVLADVGGYEIYRGLVSVAIYRPGAASNASYYAGSGYITKANLKISDNLQTQSMTISGSSILVPTT